MKWKGAGACALILVAAAAVAVAMRYDAGGGQPDPGAPTARANVPNPNMSLAPAQPPQLSSAAGALSDIQSLAARCQTAMIKDVCGIMTSTKPGSNERNTERLFIAGVGEVDAAVFNRLREAGDKMCGEVEVECMADWASPGCKIARAMYPANQ